ncbi:MAG TPA: tRNA lysidine(34) synthetase TilS [Candidatus Nanopelagicales bacterium]|nr:tRNA lysidine(34) synthetase TilS [Candidatus Nanopelagicales bacterium]
MARRALGPATLTLVQAVAAALAETDRRLLVACSGGPDSLALAQAVVHVGRRRSLPIAAVVVDHGLQASSAEQAAATAADLRTLGYADVVVRAVDVVAAGSGPEAAARAARYRALDEAATARGATVLLGHTRDDQAETVLLGLARGSGIRSLAGMAERSGPGGRWLRPLLGVGRSVTEAACRESGLMPWRDPQNLDPAFARVRVRATVLPVLEAELGPGVAEALARTAGLARDDADLLDGLAAEADPGTAALPCAVIEALPPALRRRVLGRWLRLEHGLSDLAAGHLLAVDSLLTDWHGQAGVDLPGGVRVRRVGGQLMVGPIDRPRTVG